MTKPVKAVTPSAARSASATADPESLDQLRGDCARMAPRFSRSRCTESAEGKSVHGRATELHGVSVPEKSAALLEGMSEYGD
ncbi:hypothetical protein [Streptomyces gilvosporeus]|uniref:Uncharacterized protein n=1 Tax=Streptomyces gilvosporeus TaxID=553510 RepID=A0A1V0TPX4_9ACTN|nr:hypothetical protein [Streptomyces gilvosporeus]ARF54953.1 hypothetical protein B1H19_12690 [Streptomyces gilvosporeus]